MQTGKQAVELLEQPQVTLQNGCVGDMDTGGNHSCERDSRDIDTVRNSSCDRDSRDIVTVMNPGCGKESQEVNCVKQGDAFDKTSYMKSDLGPYEVYVLCPEIKGGLGIALIDTGAQVSLVRESSLVKNIAQSDDVIEIQGISGKNIKVKGMVNLTLNNCSEPIESKYYVVNKLPRNIDVILGQDWLLRNNYVFTKNIAIPPFSESVVQFPTTEKGVRYVEQQLLQPGIVCAATLTNCDKTFPCLIVNVTPETLVVRETPILKKPPTQLNNSTDRTNEDAFAKRRIELLYDNLRLQHIEEGAKDIRDICSEFVDVFKLPGDKLTSTTAAKHYIPTPSIPKGRPITLKNYRLPQAHQEEIQRQVEQMLNDGIITHSKSEWNFPLLVVPKKIDATGKKKWRICVDFRRLNDVTVGDSYPLPNIQDILDKIGRSRYFSALDCASGYLQVPIEPEDQCKTAFSTASGHYEYTRMPFGLKSAPATFQRMMNSILHESIGDRCFCYMDDVLIMGETLAEHNKKLREVLGQLRKHNIKIEPDKCEFLKVELNYLGHVVTTKGVKPDPRKVQSVTEFPRPGNPKDIKSFLGLAGYYRKFIDGFSSIARPLTELLKKDVEWQWTEKEQNSFDLLRQKLTEAPLLQYPDFTKPFILTTDASGYAIGAILSQGKLGEDKPIAYASRTLNKAEINYSTVEKECLSIVWACKHFRPYLLGRKFTVVTDHKGLIWIFNVKDPSSRLLRWTLLLEEYDYEIKYRAGIKNCNADCLSRYPVECMQFNVEQISNERKLAIIKEMHNCPVGGHQGIQRTTERIKLYTSWMGMEKDVADYIRNCKVCQMNKDPHQKVKQQLEVTDTQDEPFCKLYLDVVGPLPVTEDNFRYILTCQDNLSKYVIAIPIKNQTVEEVTDAFVNKVILIYGIPNTIVTDQGSNFMSDVFKRICKLFKIEKINTAAYHPESNGALERTHKTLVTYLRCFCDPKSFNWNTWLPFACFSYNTTPHSITKFTPYEILYGRRCNIPGILQSTPQPLYNYDDIIQNVKFKMQNCHKIAKERLIQFKENQREKTKANPVKFKVNDLVLLRIEARHKLEPLWKGPYEVKMMKEPNAIIQEVGKRKHQEVHSNRLKPYFFTVSGNETKHEGS